MRTHAVLRLARSVLREAVLVLGSVSMVRKKRLERSHMILRSVGLVLREALSVCPVVVCFGPLYYVTSSMRHTCAG
jgi:hypothetical protein